MKKCLVAIFMAIAAACAPPPASAQSLTPGCSSPPPAYGVVWTASQWIVCLSSLQPYLGYTPLNVAGGSMSGELFLQPSVTTNAPLNFPPGSAPTSPVNGDFWFTSAGAFYRAGGVTVGPLASTTSPTLASPTFTGTVTFPDGTTWTSTTITASTALSAFWASPPVLGGTAPNAVHGTTIDSSSGHDITTGGNFTAPNNQGLQINNISGTAGMAVFAGNTGTKGQLLLGDDFGNFDSVHIRSNGSDAIVIDNSQTVEAKANLTVDGATVTFSDVSFGSCAVLGTSANVLTCGSASAFITYNDNVTTNVDPAVTGNLYCMNTGSGALSLKLPSSPANGAYVAFSDCGGNFGANNLTILRNGSNLMYLAEDMTVSTRWANGILRYSSGKSSWILSPL